MFGVSPPRGFYKGNRYAPCFVGSASLQNVIEVVFVAVTILPRYFELVASDPPRPLEIQIKVMSRRGVSKDIVRELLQTISDDLSPTMCV